MKLRIEPVEEGEVKVRDYLLLYRSRGDRGKHDLISGKRENTLRVTDDGGFQLAHRRVVVDQAVKLCPVQAIRIEASRPSVPGTTGTGHTVVREVHEPRAMTR